MISTSIFAAWAASDKAKDKRIAYLEGAVRVRDQRATTLDDNEGNRRVVTCMYCGARLYLGESHREDCETQTHPLEGK